MARERAASEQQPASSSESESQLGTSEVWPPEVWPPPPPLLAGSASTSASKAASSSAAAASALGPAPSESGPGGAARKAPIAARKSADCARIAATYSPGPPPTPLPQLAERGCQAAASGRPSPGERWMMRSADSSRDGSARTQRRCTMSHRTWHAPGEVSSHSTRGCAEARRTRRERARPGNRINRQSSSCLHTSSTSRQTRDGKWGDAHSRRVAPALPLDVPSATRASSESAWCVSSR
mmetsp:Transcript_39634/g.128248  ORF Transcript_39634/g.128248 Transcript_39634/m.128248 type:complete len:239 (+) Transcript_39634:159-875(+)